MDKMILEALRVYESKDCYGRICDVIDGIYRFFYYNEHFRLAVTCGLNSASDIRHLYDEMLESKLLDVIDFNVERPENCMKLYNYLDERRVSSWKDELYDRLIGGIIA